MRERFSIKYVLTRMRICGRLSICVKAYDRSTLINGGDCDEEKNSKSIGMCNTYGD